MTGYSGGSGGVIDLTARLGLVANTFNDLINAAQGAKNLSRGFVDEFVNSTFIDAGASANQTYDAANDLFSNLGGYTANAVPAMTSNTAPSGTASASTGASAWHAFDRTSLYWGTTGATSGWLEYDFTTVKTIEQYILTAPPTDLNRTPKNWTFEAWDGTAWVILDTQSGQTAWAISEARTFTFSNTTAYTNYRLNITATDGSASYLQVSGLAMMEAFAPLNMTLVSNPWPVTASVNSGQFTALLEPVDPVTLGTDLKAYISDDAGATFTEVTGLVDYGDFSTGIKVIAGDAAFVASGTSLVAKIQSFNIKQFKLHGWSILGG